jgi:16S rRNA (uracil1498-N3)-methyltransferase
MAGGPTRGPGAAVSAPRRLWAPPEHWTEAEVRLPPEEVHHAERVLRLRAGDEITVLDGAGRTARCVLAGELSSNPRAAIVESALHPRPNPEIVVYQGAARGTKVDSVVGRLGALGAAEVVVFSSERSVVSWDADKSERLAERWAGLARAAAKQSGNPWITATALPLTWTDLLVRIEQEPSAVMLWEEARTALRNVVSGWRIAVVVGPEGGISRAEAAALESAGAVPASLGPRILRTEEAAVAAVIGLLWHFGAIG